MRLKSFSAVGFVIALLVFGALGAGAWRYASLNSTASASTLSDSIAPRSFEYVDDVFHFKLLYPADFAVREYPEDEPGARTVAFEGPSQGEGFQVFVFPYAESSITPERFHIDDPSGVMKDAKE